MLKLYRATATGLEPAETASLPAGLPGDITWIDLDAPTAEEAARVAAWLAVEIPSREEMQEIEVSSRVYEEAGVQYMTFVTMVNADADYPATTDVALILSNRAVVTV